MRITLAIAAAFLLQLTGSDTSQFRFVRSVAVRGTSASQTACAVLPPEIFHDAAPALRDVRLFQNGQEVPYEQEVSYDQRSLATGVTADDDRSLYEPVVSATLKPQPEQAIATVHLPARVPVERLSLAAPVQHDTNIHIAARIDDNSGMVERVTATLHPGQRSLPVTLGANLQHDADVVVSAPHLEQPDAVTLEMRRRWICFDAKDASAQRMLMYGNESLPAANYVAATLPKPSPMHTEAVLGPLATIQAAPATPASPIHNHKRMILLVLGAEILLLPLAGVWLLLRMKKRAR